MVDFWTWLNGLGARRELALWVGASALAHTLGAWVAWYLPSPGAGRLASALARLRDHWAVSFLLQIIRLAYYVLVPYAVVIWRGALEAQTLGLLGPADFDQSVLGWGGEWIVMAGRMAALGLAGALVLRWGWSNLRWSSLKAAAGFWGADLGPVLREMVYLQAHWAFYRSAPLLWFGAAGEGWAPFVGAAIVALEAGLDPRVWAALRNPEQAARPLLNGALCWLSALGFALTHNLWLVAGVHAALAWGSARWLGQYLPSPSMGRRAGEKELQGREGLAQKEAQDNERAKDQPRQDADALEVADDVLVLLAHVGETGRRPRTGAEASRPGRGDDLRPLG